LHGWSSTGISHGRTTPTHGASHFLPVIRHDGNPRCFNNYFEPYLVSTVLFGHFSLHNTPEIFNPFQVWGVVWPRNHIYMMVNKPESILWHYEQVLHHSLIKYQLHQGVDWP
jgi:hypothetical protein